MVRFQSNMSDYVNNVNRYTTAAHMENLAAHTHNAFTTTAGHLRHLQDTICPQPFEAYSNVSSADGDAFQTALGIGDPIKNRMDLQEAFCMVDLEDNSDSEFLLKSSLENTESTTDEATNNEVRLADG